MAAFIRTRGADELREEAAETRGLGAAGGASLALHAGVALAVFYFTWTVVRDQAEPVPEAFRVVSPAVGANPGETARRAAGADARPDLESETERLFVAPPSVRSWTPPPPPVPAPSRTESSVPERGAVSPSTGAGPARESRVISYAEHVRLNGAPTEARRPASRGGDAGAAANGPRINVDRVRSEAGDGPVVSSSTSAASSGAVVSAMDGYFTLLRTRLRASHELPAGAGDLLSAEVSFALAANGAVSEVRIMRSSGNAEFDRSVLAAFGRVRMPARPDGKSAVQTLTFRVTE